MMPVFTDMTLAADNRNDLGVDLREVFPVTITITFEDDEIHDGVFEKYNGKEEHVTVDQTPVP